MGKAEQPFLPQTQLIILLFLIGLTVFLAITAIFPFKDRLFSFLYPKPSSFASDLQTLPPPSNLQAGVISYSQINLSWTSTTTSAVTYEVYRNDHKIAAVESTSLGDVGLNPATLYSYYVRTVSSSGNYSANSLPVTATTYAKLEGGIITGTISSNTQSKLPGATVTVTVEGTKKTYSTNSYGVYSIRNLPKGKYTLDFSAKDHREQRATVTLTLNQQITYDVILNALKN